MAVNCCTVVPPGRGRGDSHTTFFSWDAIAPSHRTETQSMRHHQHSAAAPIALANEVRPDEPVPSVLIVEDDPALRFVYERAMSRAGLAPRVAGSVRKALAAIAIQPVDCVIVDRGLPDVSGLELVRLLRSAGDMDDVRLIVVSGQGAPDERVEGLEAGADDYLAKPVSVTELVARVRAQLRTRGVIRGRMGAEEAAASAAAWTAGVITDGAYTIHFQPIVDLDRAQTIGFEALTRFADGTSPDIGFARASRAGLGVDLELATAERAVDLSRGLPAGAYVSLNLGAASVPEVSRLRAIVGRADRPVMLELTERDPVLDYEALRRALGRLGSVDHLAIDDVGNGYATLAHVLELRPDVLKLDRSWVRDLPTDPARHSLLGALCKFAGETGAELLAEGIETAQELATVRALGIRLGQGYLLGRPAPAGGARRL